MPILARISLILAATLTCALAHAQAPADPPSPRITLVTMGPGHAIYERFGHNALRIEDPSESGDYRDVAFNYGLFAFEDDFIPRFVRGRLRYWMGPERAPEMLQHYAAEGRRLTLQHLNLTPTQARDLQQFLWNNAEPENRYYFYNPFNDNCSTRLRDALDIALDGHVQHHTKHLTTGRSYRYHTRRAIASNPFVYIGLEYVLGPETDRELSPWEEMFLPELLEHHLRNLTVTSEGVERPLIASEALLNPGPDIRPAPPTATPYFLLAGLLLAAAIVLLHRAAGRSCAAHFSLALFLFAWFALSAFATSFLLTLNLFSTHWATYRNENLLQMSPAAILVLLALPLALRRSTPSSANLLPRHRRFRQFAAVAALLALALCALGVLLKLLPMFFQQNWSIIFLCLPVNAAAALVLWQRARQDAPPQP